MASKKNRRNKNPFQSESSALDSHVTREKQKARDLRKTPWWRKKIATGECHYCKTIVDPSELTMDHKIPLARGGTSERMNIVPACKECNNKKKFLLPTEWEEFMNIIKGNSDETGKE